MKEGFIYVEIDSQGLPPCSGEDAFTSSSLHKFVLEFNASPGSCILHHLPSIVFFNDIARS